MTTFDDPETLRSRLQELKAEHRALDAEIEKQLQTAPGDELSLRRLKKHKLHLKDSIALIEAMLEPDIPA